MVAAERKAWEQEQRKQRIVDMAETVFFQRGYDGATLPAIADAAGYNKRTLYLYFIDKEDIFLAVVLRGLEGLHGALNRALEQTGTNSGGLRDLAAAVFDFSMDHPQYMDLIMAYESRYFVYHNRAASTDPDSHLERCQQVSADMARLVTAAIEADMAGGWVMSDLTARQFMLILWGQILGVMKILRMPEKNFTAAFGISRRALFDRFVRMVECALSR
ncbi:MAG: helix-turn-helix domain-containing protein [Desulfobacteraceae bacterium]|jgi:AcrR family transcriptional regulator|nr:helix-turn-helix domain-containing protein [Desulfobacteraceae bacterium]